MPIVSCQQFLEAKLDYLVVGGGTAGLVVAARLTEDPNVTVGVLEAGKYHESAPEVTIPGMMARAMFNPDFDWGFRTVPQKYAHGREIDQSRGKGLGGSSLLNFMCTARPSKVELDAWEELGNPGWNWQSTVEYIKKSESFHPTKFGPEDGARYSAVPRPENHGVTGPIAKSYPLWISETHNVLLDTLELLGVHRNPDSGGAETIGSLLVTTSVDSKTATRSYSASGYYAPNARRTNLLVLTGAYATKINLAATAGGLLRATGATFTYDGHSYDTKAGKEVVLSAGTFQNPQLLELSGIGDKDILKSFGIETKIDLPGVGENLQDHALVPVVAEVDDTIESYDVLFDPVKLAEQQELYKTQKGLLSAAASTLFAYTSSNYIGSADDVKRWKTRSSIDGAFPEVFERTKPSVKEGYEKQYELLRRWLDDPTQPFSQLLALHGPYPVPGHTFDQTKHHTTIFCAYTHPFHRGTVHIQSIDPTIPPRIQPNYFSNENDFEFILRGVELALEVFNTAPFSQLVKKRVAPAAETEDELKQFIRSAVKTVHHPVGTCAMMPKGLGGVIDSKLMVYGTENLRIVDSSIIPMEVSCNPQTMAYAVGEKGADIIKAT